MGMTHAFPSCRKGQTKVKKYSYPCLQECIGVAGQIWSKSRASSQKRRVQSCRTANKFGLNGSCQRVTNNWTRSHLYSAHEIETYKVSLELTVSLMNWVKQYQSRFHHNGSQFNHFYHSNASRLYWVLCVLWNMSRCKAMAIQLRTVSQGFRQWVDTSARAMNMSCLLWTH